MKGKTKFKSIFLRAAATFFIYYLIVAITLTVMYCKSTIKENYHGFDSMANNLRYQLSEYINEYQYENSVEDSTQPWNKDENNLMTNLNTDLSGTVSHFRKNMFAKGYLYDENGKCIAKSGNFLRIDCKQVKGEGSFYWDLYRYIDLDKYFSDDEIIELYNLKNQKNKFDSYWIKGEGYIDGAEIIPKQITIFGIETKKKETDMEEIKTYKFNVKEAEGLKKIDINCFLESYLEMETYFEAENNVNKKTINSTSYQKDRQRYANLKEYSQDEIKSLKDEEGNLFKFDTNKTFNKVNYDEIYTLRINNHCYYLALKADYYLWEEILPKVIPLYVVSFSMVFIMVLILSRGLYKTYEKQEILEKNRRELTSAIAHELKTPLGIIRTYGEGLKEKIAEDKRDYYLDVIIDETYNMDKMVLEMLDLSKLEAKAYELKRESFCINDLVEGIIKKNEKIFNDKSIYVNYTSDKKYDVDADYTRIEQVINNLLSNAIYHTAENKTINIQISNEKFIIENEGEHIPKDKINLIWDTFYRVDSSRDRSERRTGVGLAIVKNILELHNMEFGVKNTAVGVEFWFKI